MQTSENVEAVQPVGGESQAPLNGREIIEQSARKIFERKNAPEQQPSPEDSNGVTAPAEAAKPAEVEKPEAESTDEAGEGEQPKGRSRSARYKARIERAELEAKNFEKAATDAIAENAALKAQLEAANRRGKDFASRLEQYGEETEVDEKEVELNKYVEREKAEEIRKEFAAKVELERRKYQAAEHLQLVADENGVDSRELALEFVAHKGTKSYDECIRRIKLLKAPEKTEAELQLEVNKKTADAAPVPASADKPVVSTENEKPPELKDGVNAFFAHYAKRHESRKQ